MKNIASGDGTVFVKPQFEDKELHGIGFHETPRCAQYTFSILACAIHTFDPDGKEVIRTS